MQCNRKSLSWHTNFTNVWGSSSVNIHNHVSRYIKYNRLDKDSIMIIIYTHNHFIRYTWIVLNWTRCWERSSEILVNINMIVSHSCCRFVGLHDVTLFPQHTPTVELNTVSSLSFSVNEYKFIVYLSLATWHVILLETAIWRWVHYSHKRTDMVTNNIR